MKQPILILKKMMIARSYKIIIIISVLSLWACQSDRKKDVFLFPSEKIDLLLSYYDKDYYDSTVQLYREFLAKPYALTHIDDSLKSKIYFAFAYALRKLDNSREALGVFQKAYQTAQLAFGQNHWKVGIMANNIAFTHRNLGNFEEAIHYFQVDIRLAPDDKSKGQSFLNLGALFRALNQFDSSAYYYQKSIELLPDKKRHQAENNLGVLYISKRELRQARVHLEKALKQRLTLLAGTSREDDIAETYNNLAFTYLVEKAYTQCLAFTEKALKYAGDRNYLRALGYQIEALHKSDRSQDALPLVWEADSILAVKQESILSSDDKLFFVGRSQHFAELGFTVNRKLNDLPSAFYFSERKKGNVLQELLAQLKSKRKIAKIQVASISDIQRTLPEGAALIEYNFAEKHLYAFVITDSKYRLLQLSSDSLDGDAIDSLAFDFRKAITSLDGNRYLDKSHILYQKIFKPLEAELSDRNKILIIPDSRLSIIPFEALLSQAPKSKETMKPFFYSDLAYLLRDYIISYNTSATLALTQVQTKGSFDMTFIGFAPSFSNTQLKPLPIAQKSAIFSAELFKKNRLFTREAKKSTFVNLVKKGLNTRILHFNTHCLASEDNPDSTALAFEDSLMFLPELVSLTSIGHNDLVALSACNAGTGRYVPGEGVISLARGFASLGTPKLLYSLWLALEKPTAGLMSQFYIYVAEGLPYNEALKRAKLDLIANGVGHPRFWSNFILSENFTAR